MVRSSKHQRAALTVSDDVAIARYDFLIAALPATLAARAQDSALANLRPEQRKQLHETMASVGPGGLREAMARDGILATVARQFFATDAVRTYFSVGAGSVDIDKQPAWVAELVRHDTAPIDAGTVHHRKGPDFGMWF